MLHLADKISFKRELQLMLGQDSPDDWKNWAKRYFKHYHLVYDLRRIRGQDLVEMTLSQHGIIHAIRETLIVTGIEYVTVLILSANNWFGYAENIGPWLSSALEDINVEINVEYQFDMSEYLHRDIAGMIYLCRGWYLHTVKSQPQHNRIYASQISANTINNPFYESVSTKLHINTFADGRCYILPVETYPQVSQAVKLATNIKNLTPEAALDLAFSSLSLSQNLDEVADLISDTSPEAKYDLILISQPQTLRQVVPTFQSANYVFYPGMNFSDAEVADSETGILNSDGVCFVPMLKYSNIYLINDIRQGWFLSRSLLMYPNVVPQILHIIPEYSHKDIQLTVPDWAIKIWTLDELMRTISQTRWQILYSAATTDDMRQILAKLAVLETMGGLVVNNSYGLCRQYITDLVLKSRFVASFYIDFGTRGYGINYDFMAGCFGNGGGIYQQLYAVIAAKAQPEAASLTDFLLDKTIPSDDVTILPEWVFVWNASNAPIQLQQMSIFEKLILK